MGEWFSFYFGNTESFVFYGVLAFIGLFFGWFFKKGNPYMMIVGLVIFSPVYTFIFGTREIMLYVPFFLGFLIHGHKGIILFYKRSRK